MRAHYLLQCVLLTAVLIAHDHLHAQSGWFRQNPTPQGNSLSSVSFTDANTGTAVGWDGTIVHTTNGGAIWTNQSCGVLPPEFFGVSFIDTNIGTAVGGGRGDRGPVIVRTTNGGSAWTDQSSGAPGDMAWLFGASFTNANTGTAVGSSGTVLRTTNGGATWISQSSGTTNRLWGVCFTDANTGTAVGDSGTILRTTNGGATWISQSSGTTNKLSSVSFTDANTGTAVGDSGTILRTNTGGVTFIEQPRNTDVPSQFVLEQNYPNPFNPSTTIRFQIADYGLVTLRVFDLLGREVASLVNGTKQLGTYTVTWNATAIASGVYFYRLQAGEFVTVKQLLLLR